MLMIGLMIVLGLGAQRVAQSLNMATVNLYHHPHTVSTALLKANSNIISMHRYMKDVALAQNEADLERAISNVNANERGVFKYFDIAATRFLGDKSRIAEAREVFADWKIIRSEVIELVRAGEHGAAAAITKGKGATYVAMMSALMDNLLTDTYDNAAQFMNNSKAEQERGENFIYALLLSVVVVGLMVAVFVYIKIHQAERKLLRANGLLNAVINGSSDAMLLMDGDKFINCNPATLDMLGYKNRKEILVLHPSQLSPSHQPDGSLSHDKANEMRAKAEEAGSHRFEWIYSRANGEHFPVEVLLTALNFEGRNLIHMVWREIGNRKQAEAQLRMAKEDAERANKAKSEFLASMSHELRTPLNAVIGFAQMLQYDPVNRLSTQQNEHIEHIVKGGTHLLELINDILDLSKIEAYQVDLHLKEVNVGDAVSNSVKLTAPLGEARNIRILNRIDDTPSSCLRTDPVRLEQILLNLISNAVKYNEDGGTVTVHGHETGDGFYRLSVSDSGIGIAKEDYSNMFHMFHRLGADPLLAQEGTGIGLTVAKFLVERMAGRIGFDSEVGIGSTFWFELPLASNQFIVIWDDTLRVGVDAIDKDHQVITSLLNRVAHDALDVEDLDEVIVELVDYTHYHFRREQAIMESCDYPKKEEHIALHCKLSMQVRELSETWREERDPEILHDLRVFLREWWTDHIVSMDLELSQYTSGKKEEVHKALEGVV